MNVDCVVEYHNLALLSCSERRDLLQSSQTEFQDAPFRCKSERKDEST